MLMHCYNNLESILMSGRKGVKSMISKKVHNMHLVLCCVLGEYEYFTSVAYHPYYDVDNRLNIIPCFPFLTNTFRRELEDGMN